MTVKIDLKKFLKKLEKGLRRSVDRSEMRRLALRGLNLIKARTRAGFGVNLNQGFLGSRFKLPPLSEEYIEQRVRRSSELSRFAFIDRPTNTFTGKMLSDFRVTSTSKGGFSLGFRTKDSRQKAEFLAKMGRNYIGFTKREFNLMIRFFEKEILNKNI